MSNKVVFEQTVAALFQNALQGRIDEPLQERLRGAGLDLSRPLEPVYPFAVWMDVIRLAAEHVFPSLSIQDSLTMLGQEFVDGYTRTFLGRLVVMVARGRGPYATVQSAAEAFRSGNNYTQVRVRERGPLSMELWMNEVGPYPEFTAGIISGTLALIGVIPTVKPLEWDGHACTYAISWVFP